MKSHSQVRGSVLLEAALVFPMILMIGFLGLDFSRAMSAYQQLSMIAREGGNMASRECPTLDTTCLQTIHNQIDSLLPGAELILSVYEADETTGVVSAGAISPGTTTASGYATRYNVARVSNEIQALNTDNTSIVITEVFYPFTQSAGISFIGQKVFYESTIY